MATQVHPVGQSKLKDFRRESYAILGLKSYLLVHIEKSLCKQRRSTSRS
jgi:hypothetical protein